MYWIDTSKVFTHQHQHMVEPNFEVDATNCIWAPIKVHYSVTYMAIIFYKIGICTFTLPFYVLWFLSTKGKKTTYL